MQQNICRYSLLLAFFLTITITASKAGNAENYHVGTFPRLYILEKLKSHDIIFLGTTHKNSTILKFISDLIPYLPEAKVTHLGLEISSNQQNKIDNFLENGTGLVDIKLHFQIDCPEYRNLIKLTRTLEKNNRPDIVALDLPESMYQKEMSRDEWMATSIKNAFRFNSHVKMLVVVGNLHVLKNIAWERKSPDHHGFIRSYLNELTPGLRAFSIGQCINGSPDQCDFTKYFSSVKNAVAVDCDGRFDRWKIGIMTSVAARPTEISDLLDGLILY